MSSLSYHHCHIVIVISTLSCPHHHVIIYQIIIIISWLSCHHYHAITIVPSLSHHHYCMTVISSLLSCHCVLLSWLLSDHFCRHSSRNFLTRELKFCKQGIRTATIFFFNYFLVEVDCGEPEAIANGDVKDYGTEYLDQASVTCDVGYTTKGPRTISCTSSGKWSEKPECIGKWIFTVSIFLKILWFSITSSLILAIFCILIVQ